jgi:hypothetical protein
VVICHRSCGRVIYIESKSAGCSQKWTQGRQTTEGEKETEGAKESEMVKAAVYARTSTISHGQSVDMQLT